MRVVSVVLHLRGLLMLCTALLCPFQCGYWLVATPTCVNSMPSICGALIRSPCPELALVPLCGAECVFDVDYPYFFEPPFSLICGPPNERDVLRLGPSFDVGSIFTYPFWAMQLSGKTNPVPAKLILIPASIEVGTNISFTV
eukprot:TRINITY_DN20504_c2_g1_i1.p1 TRINITY_DN20504_c2_g1~~TRINITY_DN20504_c2_g1_i1.p1  ORF type:complete len:142 (-),score=14.74 TRINITY_DN20504_c2_g1_i1:393-818(-)